jgi:HPt (histidine-containing phosphotransfer) domain-containing protein
MSVDSVGSDPVLDIDGTLARFGGDKELFVEMSGILLEDSPRLVNDLRHAVATNDARAVRNHAHALKGLLLGCGGVRAGRVAQALENAGQSGELRDAASLFESLEQEFEQLTRAIQEYRA